MDGREWPSGSQHGGAFDEEGQVRRSIEKFFQQRSSNRESGHLAPSWRSAQLYVFLLRSGILIQGGNGGEESACGWCKDKWGLSWQITPRILTEAMAKGGDAAKRAFAAMLEMGKIDVAKIEAAVRGKGV